MGGGEFSCAPSLLCHGLKGVVKPIRSLTRKRGQNLLCVILLDFWRCMTIWTLALQRFEQEQVLRKILSQCPRDTLYRIK